MTSTVARRNEILVVGVVPAVTRLTMDAAGESSSSQPSSIAPSAIKRKYNDLQADEHDDIATPAPPISSPQPPSSPQRVLDSITSTSHDAHKTYIARTAPHVLGRTPTPSGSRTPSVAASGRSSPSSDDDRSTPDHILSPSPASTVQSHHILPPGYRGPALRKDDPEEIAPPPHLLPTPGSATLFSITNFALNRNGWRYTTAGPSSQNLPRTVFRTLETAPAGVHWCWSDRSPFTKYSADATTVCSDKGFRSARTNVGVRSGEYYAEIEILPPEQLVAGVGAPGPIPAAMKDGAHVRVGWARREAQINAPVGFDGYSYGYRDKTGDKVTLSRPLPYGKPFTAGDVVGLYIKLPPLRQAEDEHDPANIRRERIAIRYRAQLFFESLEYPKNREMEQLMERSRKGNSLEEAYTGIEGTGIFAPHDPLTALEHASTNGIVNGMNGAVGGGSSSSAKVKNRKNPGGKDKPSGPPKPSLRPVPKLIGSKIGFFVNGEPQGIAFRDLFDFRPLRVKGFAETKVSSATKGPTKGGSAKKGDANAPFINVKARENVFDDGTLGYYPFASMYGGARARLITDETAFRFRPPDDIEAALEAVSTPGGDSESQAVKMEGARAWKPVSARFDEHMTEMWEYDLLDEARAQEAAAKEESDKERRNEAAKARYAAKKGQQRDQEPLVHFDGSMHTDDKVEAHHQDGLAKGYSSHATPNETPGSPPPELEPASPKSSTSPHHSTHSITVLIGQRDEDMRVDDNNALSTEDQALMLMTPSDAYEASPSDPTSTATAHTPLLPAMQDTRTEDVDMTDNLDGDDPLET